MNFATPKNSNYVATVVRVGATEPLAGLDNLVSFRQFGMQALIGKDVPIGTVGVLFSTEVQLSDAFAKANNLYRHQNFNQNPQKKGYLDDNRRVKAIKLRGHRSDSLFVELSAFAYLGVKPEDFTIGDVFDSINGQEICRKYMIREPKTNTQQPSKKIRRVEEKMFPQHTDTDQFWRNQHKVPQGARVIITQKLHGTSIRFGRVPVTRDLSLLEKLARWFGAKVQETEMRFVVGSRTVIKSLDGKADDTKTHQHFYPEDEWTNYLYTSTNLPDTIPAGFMVFGELIGFTSHGGAIQKNYTYDLAPGKMALYVYRVATVTPSGIIVDLPWEQVKRFCKDHGMKWVPELWSQDVDHTVLDAGPIFEGNINVLMDLRYAEFFGGTTATVDSMVPLSDPKTVDEGVCIRYEGENGPYVLKAKSPIFLGHETKLLDAGTEDLESQEGFSEEVGVASGQISL